MPAGTSSFTVRVQDAGGQSDTQALSIVINLFNAPNITTTTLQGGIVGQSYNQTLQANGGIGALTWSVSPGSLPAGLTLSPAGTISGIPTNAGTSNFTVTVTDTFNQSDTQALSISRHRGTGNHDNVATNCQGGRGLQCNLAKLGRCPTRELVGHTAPAGRSQPESVDRCDYRHSSATDDARDLYPDLHRAGFEDSDAANN